MKRKYLGKTLGALALSSMVLFGCNSQNPSSDKPQKVETKVIIDKNKLEDTFLRVVDSIKSGKLDNFDIEPSSDNKEYWIWIKTPKEGYRVSFNINHGGSDYFIYASVNLNSLHINSLHIYSNSEDVKNAFDYLSHRFGVKYKEEKPLEEILFGEE